MDYIKLNRKLMDWEWYRNINTCRLFIHMLIKANWKDGRFEGKTIPRGAFVSSIGNLAEETNLTNDEVRTALKHLISTNEITKQSFSKYTVFTVNNYSKYQDVPKQIPNQIPSSSQPIPNLFPTIEEKKEIKNKKEDTNVSKKKVFVPPTVDEVSAYCRERGNGIDAQSFVDFYTSKGWMIGKNRMKDWKAAVRTWERSKNNMPAKNKNKFNNFEQREMSKEELSEFEKELLSYGF